MTLSDFSGTSGDTRRGVESALPDIPPVAQAVVIGIGGSGVQTIARVKSMVDSKFPDAVATSALEFLGVDAVAPKKQYPPLPHGVALAPHEYVNLTETVFDPSMLVLHESQYQSPIQGWFDFTRRVPSGALADGLKQDRMLGRLAYYREGERLTQHISNAMKASAALTAKRFQDGQAAGAEGSSRPRVYIVASMCGGTGSSGLLEVVYRVWEAAQGNNVSPDVRLFLFMPGMFETAVSGGQDPAAEVASLRANAYGFLRELDHFITHSDRLADHLANPGSARVKIPAGDLVQQVYLVDSQLSSGQYLTRITDLYEATAGAVYQLLMTKVGAQVAVNGVNVDKLLQETDGYGKRRIYCGLGVTGITYPGETLRRHVSFRFGDWVLREWLLDSPVTLGEDVRSHPVTKSLFSALGALREEVVTVEPTDYVRSFRVGCASASEALAADDSDETIVRLVALVKEGRARAINEFREQLRQRRGGAVAKIESTVVGQLLDQGRSVPFMAQAVKQVVSRLKELRDQDGREIAAQQGVAAQGDAAVDRANRAISELAGWRSWMWWLRDHAAKELGEQIKAYAQATLAHERALGSSEFYTQAIVVLERLHAELDRAEAELVAESQRFSLAWHSDELVGKDSGPRDLTSLIPADILPEVEDSRLAKDSFRRILAEVTQLDAVDTLSDLYSAWRGEGESRAAFDLGSRSADKSGDSLRRFRHELARLSDAHALQAHLEEETAEGESLLHELFLPRSLADAAQRHDRGASLSTALVSAASLASHVLLPVDVNKLTSGRGLSPSTIVSRPAELAALVAKTLPTKAGLTVEDWPDRERVQVLTTAWGASAHSLSAVATWKPHYERALTLDAQGKHKPPHLAMGWASELEPLEPQYVDLPMAADVVVEALVVTRLLARDPVHVAVFGARPAQGASGVPLRSEDEGHRITWLGKTFVEDQTKGVWQARPDTFRLGSTFDDLLRNVASQPVFRQQGERFGHAVFLKAGLEVALEVAHEVAASLADLLVTNQDLPAETYAVGLLTEQANELVSELEHGRQTAVRL